MMKGIRTWIAAGSVIAALIVVFGFIVLNQIVKNSTLKAQEERQAIIEKYAQNPEPDKDSTQPKPETNPKQDGTPSKDDGIVLKEQESDKAEENESVKTEQSKPDADKSEPANQVSEPSDEKTFCTAECFDDISVDVDDKNCPVYTVCIWQIKPGQTLSWISSQTGVSVERIAQYNGITDTSMINANSALKIPNR